MKNIEIIQQNQIYLIGFSFFGDPFSKSGWWSEDNEIGHLWNRFVKSCPDLLTLYQDQITKNLYYEMHIMGSDYSKTGQYEVFVGLQIHQIPSSCTSHVMKIIPEGKYAKVTLCSEEITSDYYAELSAQINSDLYRLSDEFMYQTYDHRFKGMDKLSESEMDAYIPLIEL